MRLIVLSCLISFGLFAQPNIELEFVAGGFTAPVDIANAGDDRLFVVERPGVIKIIQADGTVNATAFLNINPRVSNSGGESGLLGLVFHPDYDQNGYFFVNYIDNSGNTVVSRFSVSADNQDVADPNSEKIVLTEDQPFGNHNGGDLAFGPDGYLYIGLGDGGAANDPGNRSQNPLTLLGKMLRIDIDTDQPYLIPPSNPFADDDFTLDEIWALGLRNPWRFSFDRLTGAMYIADVGQDDIEEISYQPPSGDIAGLNYGWRCLEGTATFDPDCGTDFNSLTPPIYEYQHGPTTGCSITGGFVYRGDQFPFMSGWYIYADFCTDRIFGLIQDDQMEWVNFSLLASSAGGISTFGEGNDGELYLAGIGGSIFHVIETTPNSTREENIGLSNFNLSPNPASEILRIVGESPEAGNFNLQIVNALGQKLWQGQENWQGGFSTEIPISQLVSGNYFLQIERQGRIFTKAFLKQ